ncbi:MAG: hypothetical protein IMZ64_00795 [Bacteroidetes bacterium]|nr:hypothetical protein [Bacteroidota bacterium]
MDPTIESDPLPEPPYPAAAARLLADALYRLLKEDQGIICQGINEDGKLIRFGVWKSEGRLSIIETQNYEIPLGTLFQMDDSEDEAITKSIFDNGIVQEL